MRCVSKTDKKWYSYFEIHNNSEYFARWRHQFQALGSNGLWKRKFLYRSFSAWRICIKEHVVQNFQWQNFSNLVLCFFADFSPVCYLMSSQVWKKPILEIQTWVSTSLPDPFWFRPKIFTKSSFYPYNISKRIVLTVLQYSLSFRRNLPQWRKKQWMDHPKRVLLNCRSVFAVLSF